MFMRIVDKDGIDAKFVILVIVPKDIVTKDVISTLLTCTVMLDVAPMPHPEANDTTILPVEGIAWALVNVIDTCALNEVGPPPVTVEGVKVGVDSGEADKVKVG
jgi:hypothetical protein